MVNGRLFPIPGQTEFGSNTRRDSCLPGRPVAEYEARYRTEFAPVRSDEAAEDASLPHHLHGNAAEWLESIAAEPNASSFVPDYPSRYVMGASIDAEGR